MWAWSGNGRSGVGGLSNGDSQGGTVTSYFGYTLGLERRVDIVDYALFMFIPNTLSRFTQNKTQEQILASG